MNDGHGMMDGWMIAETSAVPALLAVGCEEGGAIPQSEADSIRFDSIR